MFFTNSGRVYKLRAWEIPEASRKAKGTPLVNFLSISQEEKVEAMLLLTQEQMEDQNGFVFFTTKKGRVKKTEMPQFNNIRTSGIIAIKLQNDDSLVLRWTDWRKR